MFKDSEDLKRGQEYSWRIERINVTSSIIVEVLKGAVQIRDENNTIWEAWKSNKTESGQAVKGQYIDLYDATVIIRDF